MRIYSSREPPATLKLVTPPALEPVMLAEAKLHLRVEHDVDDDLIAGQIQAAREWAEGYVGERCISQVWDVYLPRWPGPGGYVIPLAPLISVDAVRYTPLGGSAITLDASAYTVSAGGILRPADAWPDEDLAEPDAVRITATAGYGTTADDVPRTIRQAILLLVGHWYANREAVNIGNIVSSVPLAAESLLWMRRRVPV